MPILPSPSHVRSEAAGYEVQIAGREPVVLHFLTENGAKALPHSAASGVRRPHVVVGHRRGRRELLRRD
ncbi:MAG: hypothetical protein L0H24_02375 [Microlunatus sp.]|nr:hypothetical protein [Microlunatus sp.]